MSMQVRIGLRVGDKNVSTSGLPMVQMTQWTNPAQTTVPASEKVFDAIPVLQDSSMASGPLDNLFQEVHSEAADALENNAEYSIDGFSPLFTNTVENNADENFMVLDGNGETRDGNDETHETHDGNDETHDGEDRKVQIDGSQDKMYGGQDETYFELEVYKKQVQELKKQLDDAKQTIMLKNCILSKLSEESLNERRAGWANTVKTCLDDFSQSDSVKKLVNDICIKVVEEIDRHPAVQAFVSVNMN